MIGDRVSVDLAYMKLVKVSDEIPKIEQILGATLTDKIGDEYNTLNLDDKNIHDFGNGIYGTMDA